MGRPKELKPYQKSPEELDAMAEKYRDHWGLPNETVRPSKYSMPFMIGVEGRDGLHFGSQREAAEAFRCSEASVSLSITRGRLVNGVRFIRIPAEQCISEGSN